MGLYLYIVLVGLEGSPRRLFLCIYDTNEMYMITLQVDGAI